MRSEPTAKGARPYYRAADCNEFWDHNKTSLQGLQSGFRARAGDSFSMKNFIARAYKSSPAATMTSLKIIFIYQDFFIYQSIKNAFWLYVKLFSTFQGAGAYFAWRGCVGLACAVGFCCVVSILCAGRLGGACLAGGISSALVPFLISSITSQILFNCGYPYWQDLVLINCG